MNWPINAFSSSREATALATRQVTDNTQPGDSNLLQRINGQPSALSLFHDSDDPRDSTVSPEADATSDTNEEATFDELKDRAESLESSLNGSYRLPGAKDRQAELNAINVELERRSLDALEEHLVETENEQDNVISEDDLFDLANDGTADEEIQNAAQFFLDNKELRDELDVADDDGGSPNGRIGLGDIHARQLAINEDIENVDAPTDRDSETYTLPDDSKWSISSAEQTKPRDQAEFDLQQDAIEESIRTGEEVEFVNSNGETITVQVESSSKGSEGKYTLHVDGNEIPVDSQIELDDTIAGIASIVEFGSTMDVPDNIRRFPDSVRFQKGPDGNANASYNGDDRLSYYKGDSTIQNRERYHHEIAHGIGRDLDDNSLWFTEDASPEGWPDIHEQIEDSDDETFVSDYADTNERESFAEAFTAYLNAKSYGELDAFREEFPLQAAYIDEKIFGIVNAPS